MHEYWACKVLSKSSQIKESLNQTPDMKKNSFRWKYFKQLRLLSGFQVSWSAFVLQSIIPFFLSFLCLYFMFWYVTGIMQFLHRLFASILNYSWSNVKSVAWSGWTRKLISIQHELHVFHDSLVWQKCYLFVRNVFFMHKDCWHRLCLLLLNSNNQYQKNCCLNQIKLEHLKRTRILSLSMK